MDFEQFCLSILLCLLGFAAHILKSMKQVGNGWDVSVFDYLMKYPKQTGLAFLLVVGVIAGLFETDQLNMTTGFATGYMANSAADMVTGRAIKQLR